MKKIFLVVLIAVAVIVSGCSGDKTADKPAPESDVDAVLVAGSFFVIDAENMSYLTDAIARKDTEYLNQLILEGKVFKVDKDTKVTRFGVAADENNVLIKFKEGRYTNKAGCTFKQRVYTEEEYQRYLENLTEETTKIIQEFFVNTDNYFEVVNAEYIEESKRISDVCLSVGEKLKMIKSSPHVDSECIKKVENILVNRYMTVSSYLSVVEYSQKAAQEQPRTRNFDVYTGMKNTFKKNVSEYHQKAEQARQEFRDKYGY